MRKELVKASGSCCACQWEDKSQNWQDRKENEEKKEGEKDQEDHARDAMALERLE